MGWTLNHAAPTCHVLQAEGHGAYLYVASGQVTLGDHNLYQGDAAKISGQPGLEVTAQRDSELAVVVVPVQGG